MSTPISARLARLTAISAAVKKNHQLQEILASIDEAMRKPEFSIIYTGKMTLETTQALLAMEYTLKGLTSKSTSISWM